MAKRRLPRYIDQLPSGRYRGRFQFDGAQHTFIADTLDNVEGMVRKARYELERGLWIDTTHKDKAATSGSRTTLTDAIDRYVLEVTVTRRKPEIERATWTVIQREPIAEKYLADITAADIEALRTQWRARKSPRSADTTGGHADAQGGYAIGTINRRIGMLESLFTHASRPLTARDEGEETGWGMVSLKNPVLALPHRKRQLKGATERSRRLSDDEIEAWIAGSRAPELPAFMRLLLSTAMRRGELAALKWAAVDFEAMEAQLDAAGTKNSTPRKVPLPATAITLLQGMRATAIRGDKALFHHTPKYYTRAAHRALRRARDAYLEKCAELGRVPSEHWLVDARLHDLRHEAASRYAKEFELLELAVITGHKTMRMLQRYYHGDAGEIARRM